MIAIFYTKRKQKAFEYFETMRDSAGLPDQGEPALNWSHTYTSQIGIIGGGASGVVLAANLLRRLGPQIEIVLIEKQKVVGQGLAYSTWDPNHLLNVRAGNMSAYADQPDHFYNWLQIHGPRHGIGCPTHFCFVPRGVYGEYIGGLLHDHADPHRLNIVRDECVGISLAASGADLILASGDRITVDYAVLATGNEARLPVLAEHSHNPWEAGVLDRIRGNSPVLIVGTGLTMVDVVLSLFRRGHRGPITAISRRGLLSQPHQLVPSRTLSQAEVPFGAPVSELLRWVRRQARQAEAEGANWRSTIDAVRPHTQQLWKAMSLDQRRRFLRHTRPGWDVCRHRMAPQIADLIKNLRAEGRLRIVAARIVGAEGDGELTAVTLRHRGGEVTETISVAAVLDCSGLPDDPRSSTNPVIKSLLAAGLVRPGPLEIGLDLADNGALIGAGGLVSSRLFAIGPLARGVLWESTALPDIRNQCAELATLLGSML